MLNKKGLLAAVLLVSSVCAYGVNEKTKYFLKFGDEKVLVTRQGLNLSSVLNNVVEEFGEDETYFNSEKNTFTIDINSFLDYIHWDEKITDEDIKTFATLLDGNLDLNDIVSSRVITLIMLADFFGATKNESEEKKRDLFNKLIVLLASRIQEKHYFDFANEKGLIWKISSRLNKNVLVLFQKMMAKKQNKEFKKLEEHRGKINQFLLLQNGNFVSGNIAGEIMIWSQSGDKSKLLYGGASIDQLLLLPNGNFLSLSWIGEAIIWSQEGNKINTFKVGMKAQPVLLLSNGNFVSSDSSEEIIIWSQVGDKIRTLEGGSRIFLPTNQFLLLQNGNFASGCRYGEIIIWSQAGDKIRTLEGHKKGIMELLLLQNGYFVSVGRDKKIIIWSQNGNKIRTLKGFKGIFRQLFLLHNGNFALVDSDGKIIIWSQDGDKIKTLEGLKGYAIQFLVLPDGRFVSGDSFGKIIIRSEVGDEIRTFEEHKKAITQFLLLPNGNFVSGDKYGKIIIWDILDLYSNLSFEQFVFVKMLRLYSRNPQELKKVEKRLVKNKTMINLYNSLPISLKKLIKNLKWLPLLELDAEFLNNLKELLEKAKNLVFFQTKNFEEQKKQIRKIIEDADALVKKVSASSYKQADSISLKINDVKILILILEAFEYHIKKNNLKKAREAIKYLKKEGTYIPQKRIDALEKKFKEKEETEKIKKLKSKERDVEEEGEEG